MGSKFLNSFLNFPGVKRMTSRLKMVIMMGMILGEGVFTNGLSRPTLTTPPPSHYRECSVDRADCWMTMVIIPNIRPKMAFYPVYPALLKRANAIFGLIFRIIMIIVIVIQHPIPLNTICSLLGYCRRANNLIPGHSYSIASISIFGSAA